MESLLHILLLYRPKNLCDNPGNFKLEFGLSDEKWQYAKTLELSLKTELS